MSEWRGTRDQARKRTLANFSPEAVQEYASLVGDLSARDRAAYLQDLRAHLSLTPGMRILDAGAGTGSMCAVLTAFSELAVTALEPAPAMVARLRSDSTLAAVDVALGFCDAPEDRSHFAASRFDAIVSRQVVNHLYDPLAAFANWHYWLKPGGVVAVIDGLYDRDAWTGSWEQEVDVLPASACRTLALIPYLLEQVGFEVRCAERMPTVNALPTTRTPRYLVVARR